MELKPVAGVPESSFILYSLLKQRTPEQSISHKEMPSWPDHIQFIASEPYLCWYLIFDEDAVGAIYLTKQREIGIGIFNQHQFKGYGKQAVKMLIEKHPGPFYANINPNNFASRRFFGENFDGQLIQYTYKCSI